MEGRELLELSRQMSAWTREWEGIHTGPSERAGGWLLRLTDVKNV